MHGYLRARSGLAGNGLNLDRAVKNLGDLKLQETAQQSRSAPRKGDLRSATTLSHIQDIGPYAHTTAIALAGHLLAGRQQRLGTFDVYDDVVGVKVDALDGAMGNLAGAVGKGGVEGLALCLADALQDDLLGRLCRDPAEILRSALDEHGLAKLSFRLDGACLFERDLQLGIGHLLGDLLDRIDTDLSGVLIDPHLDIRRRAKVALVGRDQRGFDSLHHDFGRQLALGAQLVDCQY